MKTAGSYTVYITVMSAISGACLSWGILLCLWFAWTGDSSGQPTCIALFLLGVAIFCRIRWVIYQNAHGRMQDIADGCLSTLRASNAALRLSNITLEAMIKAHDATGVSREFLSELHENLSSAKQTCAQGPKAGTVS